MTEHIKITIPEAMPRTRLEDFLFEHFPNLSRMYLREIVRDARCQVNGRHENIGFRVRGGDFVEIELDPSRETAMRAQDIPLDIVFEDGYLIVVNKPAGMLVHPTHRDKSGTMLNALVFYLNAERGMRNDSNAERGMRIAESDRNAERGMRIAESVQQALDRESFQSEEGKLDVTNSAFRVPPSAFTRPGLVHRLDKQTSGLIVVAKSTRVHRILAKQFQRKLVEKKYLALVEGIVESDDGVIDGSIGRYAEEKRWDLKPDGKHARSRFRVLERKTDTTVLELEPVTGRTNQLRIHTASIGHAIVGDVARGGREFERVCLHAWSLAFRHPENSESRSFECPIKFGET